MYLQTMNTLICSGDWWGYLFVTNFLIWCNLWIRYVGDVIAGSTLGLNMMVVLLSKAMAPILISAVTSDSNFVDVAVLGLACSGVTCLLLFHENNMRQSFWTSRFLFAKDAPVLSQCQLCVTCVSLWFRL